MKIEINSDGVWYHGSNVLFSELREGSTITQWRELAEAFSHQPTKLSYNDNGEIVHNGTQKGYLYVIDEHIEIGKDVYQHPRTSMDENAEFLTKRPLAVRLIQELTMDYITFIRSKVGHDKIFLNCVAAAIMNESGEVLLQKRSDRNTWGFPGGVMELGESFSKALRREVKEETGLSVSIEKLIGIYSDYSDKYPNGDEAQPIVAFFLCKIESGELSSTDEETLELRFFKEKDMPQVVNNQHIDMFNDLFNRETDVIIS